MSHIARELKMLFYLNSNINRYVKIDELADLLEITPRQVRRYRDDLDQNGYFVDELRGPAGGYKLAEPLDKSLMIPDNIMLALNIAAKNNESLLKSLNDLPVTSKVVSYISSDNILTDDQLDILTSIIRAINDKKKISFDYKLDYKNQPIEVDPYRLIYTNHTYYLKGYNPYNNAIRQYDIDKITNVKILEDFKYQENITKEIEESLLCYGIKNEFKPKEITLRYFNENDLGMIERLLEYKCNIDHNNKLIKIKITSDNELFYPLFSLGTKKIEIVDKEYKNKYMNYLKNQLKALENQ